MIPHFVRIILCIIFLGFWLFAAVEHQNRLTDLKMQIPILTKQVEILKEKQSALLYEVEQFEDPTNLLHLSQQPEYGHLKYPFQEQIFMIERKS